MRVVVVGLMLIAVAGAALADVATPRPKWTTVRMVAEEVNVTLGEQKVEVEATFEMQNTGEAAKVEMGYPVGQFETALNGFAVTADKEPVSDIRSQQGGATPSSPRPRGGAGGGGNAGATGAAAEPYRFEGPYKEWKVFSVPFGANEKKTIRVSYSVEPARVTDAEKGALLHYSYTMKTGATWKGKIETGVVRVKLNGVSSDQLVRVTPNGCAKTDGGKVLTWTMKDFKPTDDIEITFRPAAPKSASAR
jgi:hypothetical protein